MLILGEFLLSLDEKEAADIRNTHLKKVFVDFSNLF
jgi:hypothetical protein